MTNEFTARYFDGQTSRPRVVTVQLEHIPVRGAIRGDAVEREFDPKTAVLHPPLANDPVRIDLPDGATLEIEGEADAYAALRPFFRHSFFEECADRLERHWKGTAATLTALIVLGALTFAYGIPWAAHHIAMSLSQPVIDSLSDHSSEFLEQRVFQSSEIPVEHQLEIRRAFEDLLVANGLHPEDYDLRFRRSARLGANAFALPSGTIYLLDDLVELADDDDQIVAVLAHESAHVVKRHGIQGVLRSTGVYSLFSVLIGDVTSLASLATALPAMLIDAGYSREFETEADLYGAELLLAADKDPENLNVMLLRLTAKSEVSLTPEMLASHPDAAKRVEAVRQFTRSAVKTP